MHETFTPLSFVLVISTKHGLVEFDILSMKLAKATYKHRYHRGVLYASEEPIEGSFSVYYDETLSFVLIISTERRSS